MKPKCYNRPPFAEGYWRKTGLRYFPVDDAHPFTMKFKPVFRWYYNRFEDRCVIHDGRGIGPNGESYPAAHGWDCTGCRWNPVQHQPNWGDFINCPPKPFPPARDYYIDAFEPIHRSIRK